MITCRNNKFYLCITRFNNTTFSENERFRENNGINGCIYGSPSEMPAIIINEGKVFVFEMNNQKNKIMGIGYMFNKHDHTKYKIYNNNDYNRYCYKSDFRVDRAYMKDNDIKYLKYIECALFKGSTHQKRGHGFNRISPKNMKKIVNNDFSENNILSWLKELFIRRGHPVSPS